VKAQSLGISFLPSRRLSIGDIVRLTRRAEARGFTSVWIPETWGADAVSVLAVLARETARISLASGVLNVFSRSPGVVAQSAATLQDLSDGRFILGLGSSGPAVIENFHGVPFRRPVTRTRDYVNIVRLALSGQTINYESADFFLRGFRLRNPPEVVPPIYIAALGRNNVRLTGEIADGWLPIFTVRGAISGLLTELRDSQRSAGRARESVAVGAYIPGVSGRRGRELVAQQIAFYAGGMGRYYAEFLSRLGYAEEVQRVRALWTQGNVVGAVAAVPDELLERASMLTPADAAAFRSEGIDVPILAPPHGTTVAELERTIDEFGAAGGPYNLT